MSTKKKTLRAVAMSVSVAVMAAAAALGGAASAQAYTATGAGYSCPAGVLSKIHGQTVGLGDSGQNRRAYLATGAIKLYKIPLSKSGISIITQTSWRTLSKVTAYGNVAAYFAAQGC